MKQVKILQVLPELSSGGVERGTVEVSSALATSEFQSIVASAGGKMTDSLLATGAKHVTYPMQSKNPLTIWMNSQRLASLIRREGISLIHARSRAPAWAAYYAAKATKTPFITTFHGVYNGHNNALKHRYNNIMVSGERVIAVSNFINEHVQQFYNVPPEKITTIHRGADVDYFHPEKANGMRVMELCKEWNAPEGLPIILLPGRLTRWKGQHVLLEALQLLKHRNFFCVFLGEAGKHPTYVRELEKKVAEYELHGHVKFASVTQDMRAAYAAATVVVSPAIEPEAFGRVPVEAQAMGKPIIATAHGGAMETVITGQGGTGWLTTPNNPRELSLAVDEALHFNETDLQALGLRARQNAEQNFSTHTMCHKVLEVYREILSQKRV